MKVPSRLRATDGSVRSSRVALVTLAAILAAGCLLRFVPIVSVLSASSVVWDDPDGYAYSGAFVADHPGHWAWLRDVVQFQNYLKAPLYPAMMIAFAKLWRSAFPLNAAVFQVVLALVGGLALFRIGQRLHSDRAGLIAAALYTFYLPNFGQLIFLQETLFIPLSLAAFAILLRAIARRDSLGGFALAGFVFGLTALTRSLPLYYLPAAAVLYVLWTADRRGAIRNMAVLLLAFFTTVLPYSVFISAKWGQWVFVDTQGMRAIVETYSDHPASHRPGMVESLRMVTTAVANSPAAEIQKRLEKARAFFYLKGGQWIQVYAPLCSRAAEGLAVKIFVHLTHDLVTVATLLLCPFGFAMARNRQSAILLILWPLVALPLMIAFLWSGARYTSSFLPQLMAGTAVVLAGNWRKPLVSGLVVALLCSALVAIPVAASIPLTARARADYAPRLRTDGGDCSASERVMDGDAGFNVVSTEGLVAFDVELLDPAAAGGHDLFVDVRVDGRRAAMARFRSDGKVHVGPTTMPSLAFMEMRVLQGASAHPRPMRVRMETGQLYRVMLSRCP